MKCVSRRRCYRNTCLLIICCILIVLPACSNQSSENGAADNYIIADTELSDSASTVLLITDSLIPGTCYIFRYHTDSSFSSVKLYRTEYVNGEKTDDQLLLQHQFADSRVDSPREGWLLIDLDQNRVIFRDIIDLSEPDSREHIDSKHAREETQYESDNWLFFFFSRYADAVIPKDGVVLSNIVHESRTDLLFVGNTEADHFSSFTQKTMEQILASEELMSTLDSCYVFYCVFE